MASTEDVFANDAGAEEAAPVVVPPPREEMDITGVIPANAEFFAHWKNNPSYKDLSLEADRECSRFFCFLFFSFFFFFFFSFLCSFLVVVAFWQSAWCVTHVVINE